MRAMRMAAVALAAALMATTAGCASDGGATTNSTAAARMADVTVTTAAGQQHRFRVEIARTREEQDRGLMFRTDIPADGGMLFTPYPAEGGGPREAGFWMKNTPTSLDILFLREDGTIARVAENTVPFDETTVRSFEPVSAVLEILGGKAAELGIRAGDKVTWTGV